MVRSANTGISAFIDPYGAVIEEIGLGEQGYLDVLLPARLDRTLYSSSGEWPWLTMVLLMLLWLKFSNQFIFVRT